MHESERLVRQYRRCVTLKIDDRSKYEKKELKFCHTQMYELFRVLDCG